LSAREEPGLYPASALVLILLKNRLVLRGFFEVRRMAPLFLEGVVMKLLKKLILIIAAALHAQCEELRCNAEACHTHPYHNYRVSEKEGSEGLQTIFELDAAGIRGSKSVDRGTLGI